MGLGKVTVGNASQTAFKVPDGALSLVAFTYAGDYVETVTNTFVRARGLISTDLNQNYASLVSGDASAAQTLICSSDQKFPEFPVSAGESLLVAGDAAGSAIIWFNTAE